MKHFDYRSQPADIVLAQKRRVIALHQAGTTIKEIAQETGFSGQAVRNIIRAYQAGGLAALAPQRRGRKAGEMRSLTPAQEADLLDRIIDHRPPCYLGSGVWTRECLQRFIHTQYGVDMPMRTVSEYLKRWNITKPCPIYHTNDGWLQTQYSRIRENATLDKEPVFWVDKAGLRIGERRLRMIRAYGNHKKLHFLLYSGDITERRQEDFLEGLTSRDNPSITVVLNYRNSKKVTAWAKAYDRKIHIYYVGQPFPDADEYAEDIWDLTNPCDLL